MLASAMQISRKVCCAVICYPKPAFLLSQSLLYRLTALYLWCNHGEMYYLYYCLIC